MVRPVEDKPLCLAIIWHMHQPYYKLGNEYQLPWVRLHAIKDYYTMAAILEDFPQAKLTFNLTPSLLLQLKDYVSQPVKDTFWELTKKPAAELTAEERIFILYNFFMAHWENMIRRFPRYGDLLYKRGYYTSYEELKKSHRKFSSQDLLDLQVWFNLVYFNSLLRENDPFLKHLMGKGRNFTEEEKATLMKKQEEIISLVIPEYQKLAKNGQIELTTSPFHHPILPLLCDTELAKVALPNLTLPSPPFSHPEDAQEQIKRGIKFFREHLGINPLGMWPPEGAVSEEIIPLIEEAGIKWIASDEEILFHSLKRSLRKDFLGRLAEPEVLYQPYQVKVKDKELSLIFRDRILSDLIGFTYQYWEPEKAVANLLDRLKEIKNRLALHQDHHLVTIILDGENAWEFYPDDGIPFLKALYGALSQEENLKMTTVSDYLTDHPPQRLITRLYPGSWINHNFRIWIGHHEDNLAWEYLGEAREALARKGIPLTEAAWEEIYMAESSDWCWWYGDDHNSSQDIKFDELFRGHLINAYRLMGEQPPEHIFLPITPRGLTLPQKLPRGLIRPELDGKISHYFEWLEGGLYEVGKFGGTMHQATSVVKKIYYGFDLKNLYLAIEPNIDLKGEEYGYLCLEFRFLLSPLLKVRASMPDKDFHLLVKENNKWRKVKQISSWAMDRILELGIPFADLGLRGGARVEVFLILTRDNLELERWPRRSPLLIELPEEDYQLSRWQV